MKTTKIWNDYKQYVKEERHDGKKRGYLEALHTALYVNGTGKSQKVLDKIWYSNLWPNNAIKTVLYWRKCAKQHYSDWFVDECDSTMNQLMIHSLEFHMHLRPEKPVTSPLPGERGEKALRVIAALKEEKPEMHPELSDYYLNKVHFVKEKESDEFSTMVFPDSERIDELRELDRQEDLEYFERQQAARKEFIDLLPSLWS
jgi:hypothetical protein